MSLNLATPVMVDDATVFGIGAVLDGFGTGPGCGGIRGVVVDATTGEPIEGIRVRCIDESYGFVSECTTHTKADGSYQLAGFLTNGEYLVSFTAPNGGWADEWYDDSIQAQPATPVSVVEGEWSEGVDAALEPAGAISGTVTNAGGGAFSHLTVTVFRSTGTGWELYKMAQRASETDYDIGGLPDGAYRAKFRGGSAASPEASMRLEFFADAECSGGVISAATSGIVVGAHDWLPVSGVASTPSGAVAARLGQRRAAGDAPSSSARSSGRFTTDFSNEERSSMRL